MLSLTTTGVRAVAPASRTRKVPAAHRARRVCFSRRARVHLFMTPSHAVMNTLRSESYGSSREEMLFSVARDALLSPRRQEAATRLFDGINFFTKRAHASARAYHLRMYWSQQPLGGRGAAKAGVFHDFFEENTKSRSKCRPIRARQEECSRPHACAARAPARFLCVCPRVCGVRARACAARERAGGRAGVPGPGPGG